MYAHMCNKKLERNMIGERNREKGKWKKVKQKNQEKGKGSKGKKEVKFLVLACVLSSHKYYK